MGEKEEKNFQYFFLKNFALEMFISGFKNRNLTKEEILNEIEASENVIREISINIREGIFEKFIRLFGLNLKREDYNEIELLYIDMALIPTIFTILQYYYANIKMGSGGFYFEKVPFGILKEFLSMEVIDSCFDKYLLKEDSLLVNFKKSIEEHLNWYRGYYNNKSTPNLLSRDLYTNRVIFRNLIDGITPIESDEEIEKIHNEWFTSLLREFAEQQEQDKQKRNEKIAKEEKERELAHKNGKVYLPSN